MGGRGYSSVYYRRNPYRRKRWLVVVLAAAVIIVALFAVFLVIGNILNSKTSEAPKSTNGTSSNTSDTLANDFSPSYSINGYGIDISKMSTSDFSSAAHALAADGADTVSFKLTDDNGILLYSSKTAQAVGYQNNSTSLMGLSSIYSSLRTNGLRSSGCITVTFPNETDGKIRAIKMSYEAALACEIIEGGINDVVIRYDKMSVENIDMLTDLGNDIKDINKDATVGIALTKEILSSPDASVYVDKLKKAYNFICIDLSDVEDEDIAEYVGESVSENLLYILRDNMRILLPTVDTETLNELKDILAKNNVFNWQII